MANKYAIKLEKDKSLFYKLLYTPNLIDLETFKIYIETNLANSFTKLLKLLISAFIIFVKKFNSNFRLYIDYQ